MSADLKNPWVSEGQNFAGGVLTAKGAAEVNGHRLKVTEGTDGTVTQKVLGSRNVSIDENLGSLKEALETTPW